MHTVNRQRLIVAVLLVALIPLVWYLPALATLGVLTVLMVALIGYEAVRFAAARDRVRHQEEIATSGPQPADDPQRAPEQS